MFTSGCPGGDIRLLFLSAHIFFFAFYGWRRRRRRKTRKKAESTFSTRFRSRLLQTTAEIRQQTHLDFAQKWQNYEKNTHIPGKKAFFSKKNSANLAPKSRLDIIWKKQRHIAQGEKRKKKMGRKRSRGINLMLIFSLACRKSIWMGKEGEWIMLLAGGKRKRCWGRRREREAWNITRYLFLLLLLLQGILQLAWFFFRRCKKPRVRKLETAV